MIRYESPASDQRTLRRRIAKLKAVQSRRVELAEKTKADIDASVCRGQREIDNLEASITIGAV